MQNNFALLLSTSLLLLLSANRGDKCFAQGAPISETYDIPQGTEFKNEVARTIDQDVQELEKLKIPPGQGESVSVVKSHESLYTNKNGKEKAIAKIQQQVNKNGELLAKLEQKVLSQNDQETGGRPDTKVQMSVDIPNKGIHKQTSYKSDEEPRKWATKRFGYKKYSDYTTSLDPEASPEEMAAYIFFTKDDKSVTQAIEKLIQDGRLDREAALAYLGLIDKELFRLDARYPLDFNRDNVERPIAYHKNYDSTDFNDIVDGTSAELKEMQQILREKFAKRDKVVYEEDEDSMRLDRFRKVLEDKMHLTDSQYQQLLETLSSADFAYAQNMMDEIIYQLAKVMFNQALYIGGSEAQESLQKFTDFLETEASRGRISRVLEKKILELLIMSLSDTLNEHPELMDAAKQGFSKYLDAYPNLNANEVQKKNEPKVRRNTALGDGKEKPKKNDTGSVKRSVKTSGIEDGDNAKY
ncbi:uncharacterized protein LOC126840380 [Adelges cooleyi]|uniref:uncharacterized protein LOC126840380 n=1 Tax=Adelges cooleyi TaxID=133065 RepID=UPI00218061AC|nr:uncharacterized protein LOC126840380 [Adelges cooleyi]